VGKLAVELVQVEDSHIHIMDIRDLAMVYAQHRIHISHTSIQGILVVRVVD
jgi:metal-sulfur cluster biosynthetic enzyme